MFDFHYILDSAIESSKDGSAMLIIGENLDAADYALLKIKECGKDIRLHNEADFSAKYKLVFVYDKNEYEPSINDLFDIVEPGGIFAGNNYFDKNFSVKKIVDDFMRSMKLNFGFWGKSWIIYKSW